MVVVMAMAALLLVTTCGEHTAQLVPVTVSDSLVCC